MDRLIVWVLSAVLGFLNLLPLRLRLGLVEALIRVTFFVMPSLKRVSLINLKIAFPNESDEWRQQILRNSYQSLARMFIDFARMPKLDSEWVHTHIECPFLERLKVIKAEHPGKGIVYATGHLGSFELLAHSGPMFGYPMSFVVRNATMPNVDAWWRAQREKNGNHVINRKGAVREILDELGRGRDVGILFDQNVRSAHAVFVDWFGLPAATTKTVALVAIRSEAPVAVAGVRYLGKERYRIEVQDFDFRSIYADQSLSNDEKVQRITQQLSSEYEKIIRLSPAEWFWMHRRWKTRPEGEAENIYS